MTAMSWPINARPGDTVMLDVPTDILCSFHYFGESDMAAIRSWGTRIIGDSGAFSAETGGVPIDREAFHAWVDRWRDALFWVAALDVIGDPKATRGNWVAAQRDGLSLVPTIHYGAEPEAMDWYVDRGVDFIGLGGMVPFSSEPDRLMRWVLPFFLRVRDNYPHVRFHGWGISHPRLLDRLPWWSADSSGFAAAFRFATMRLFDPRSGKFFGINLDGREPAKHRALLARYYGLNDWQKIGRSTPSTRRDVGRVAIKAVQLYAHWLQARQAVTAPASLLARLAVHERGVGPVLASSSGGDKGLRSRGLNPHGDTSDVGSPITTPPVGPLSVAGQGRDTGVSALNPVGPLSVTAMGAPAMQPLKALDPDGAPGPLPVMAMGAAFSGQLQSIDPNHGSAPRWTEGTL